MKKLVVVIACALIGSGAYAQGNKAVKPAASSKKEVAVEKQTETTITYTMMEGKLVMNKGSETTSMDQDIVKFENGNYLMREGTFVFNSGTEKVMLSEGQKVSEKGELIMKEGADIMNKGAEQAKPASAQPASVEPAEAK